MQGHPTRQVEHETLLVKALAIAAAEVSKGDKRRALELADHWIEEATREYAVELLCKLADTRITETPCGHC